MVLSFKLLEIFVYASNNRAFYGPEPNLLNRVTILQSVMLYLNEPIKVVHIKKIIQSICIQLTPIPFMILKKFWKFDKVKKVLPKKRHQKGEKILKKSDVSEKRSFFMTNFLQIEVHESNIMLLKGTIRSNMLKGK